MFLLGLFVSSWNIVTPTVLKSMWFAVATYFTFVLFQVLYRHRFMFLPTYWLTLSNSLCCPQGKNGYNYENYSQKHFPYALKTKQKWFMNAISWKYHLDIYICVKILMKYLEYVDLYHIFTGTNQVDRN